MPRHTARSNARKQAVRARADHVFAHHEERMRLFVRTLGLEQARIGLTNLANNFQRLVFHERRAVMA